MSYPALAPGSLIPFRVMNLGPGKVPQGPNGGESENPG